ncbi:hypothetical protein JRO89_XS15G0186200 [Xanthoceras sorbifolium]|uniref:ABC-2 type transporter transmembrane domain-containing protein n=1 Tax=Xanthoceras sorbifolium TaxID=99658 RepID=A0ABQ8H2Z3_9ROSI|nr:hypothetical protein JRO89_XS15G0186200 [Xanthoceras sorbifolium]
MEYFSSLRFIPEIAMNPAEFLIDLATGQVNDISVPEGSLASQVLLILIELRTFKERCRDYFDKLRLVQALGIAVLLGLLWWKSQTGTEAQLRDQVGLIFYICIFWISSSIFGAVYVFRSENIYLVKERKADMYRLSVYYACSTLCNMVAHVFYPTVFMVIVYFMAGFKRTVPCFFLTLFSILLIPVTSQGAGELFGAAVLNIKRGGMNVVYGVPSHHCEFQYRVFCSAKKAWQYYGSSEVKSTNAQVLLLDDIVHQKFRFGALEFHDLLQICFNDNKHFVLLIFVSGNKKQLEQLIRTEDCSSTFSMLPFDHEEGSPMMPGRVFPFQQQPSYVHSMLAFYAVGHEKCYLSMTFLVHEVTYYKLVMAALSGSL